jgi:ribonucleoside-triphosphate reductase
MITDRLSKVHHMPFMLSGLSQEPVAQRFAKLDLRHASPESGHFVKGNIAQGKVYYTDSILLSSTAQVSPFERLQMEGLFHNLLPAGACSFFTPGSDMEDEKKLMKFLSEVFEKTENEQIAL